ncbi:hypothetical protein [Lysobacter auxotrophicus]|uniref:Lipoprotein n=1 Tax=Lysobacter auxotrophicus TaxID=2992573 RepID=A0ABN6UPI4_9GAMM|nr:hypothetical protein [Lysobacter auxotrophicus]BDU18281.1 hypothetical protein LA521A_34820 [Lysobacter auxotrophicus]
MRDLLAACCIALAVAACHTAPSAGPSDATPAVVTDERPAAPVTVTRGEFTLPADKLDVWNAVGQIVVNARGVEYLGRAQMLDLYSLRYRGVEFLVLTKAMTAAETGNRTRTRVTATTMAGKPIDEDATAEVLGMLQRALPAEVERVRRLQAAPAKKKPAKRGKP